MSEINLKCKNCGAAMQVDKNAKMITCIHCGASHLLSEILDEKDFAFLEKFNAEELENKLLFNDAIKQGETFLFKAEYSKAEEAFKLAISYDENNYKGYLGVVKAKTSNFNKLPSSSDYEEYAKSALKFADNDDYVYVKNELSKISILKEETNNLKKIQESKTEKEKHIEAGRRIKVNFFSKLAYFLTGFIAVVVLIGLVVSTIIKDKEKHDIPATIEICSVDEFLNFASNEKYFKSTIILKNDLDFNGKTIEPIGKDKFFSGAFRGNGYFIKNLNISKSKPEDNCFIGLFAKLDGAKISGIKLENVSVVYENTSSTKNPLLISTGILAGYAKNTDISNCEIDETCKIKILNSYSSIIAGGVIGELDSSSIKVSYANSLIEINETDNDKSQHLIGGLVGYLNDSSITASYCSSIIKTDINFNSESETIIYVSGIAGTSTFKSVDSKISHCFFSGSIDAGTLSLNKTINIASISCFDQTVNTSKVYTNFSLFDDGNFVLDGNNLLVSDISDFSSEDYSVPLNKEALIEKIGELLSSEKWENLNSLKPTIKSNKNASTENDAFLFFLY